MLRKLGHAYEVYPIIGLFVIVNIVLVYTAYISFQKIEVWADRCKSVRILSRNR